MIRTHHDRIELYWQRFRRLHWLRTDARMLGYVTVHPRWWWQDNHGRVGR
jgi:hypothetical protein